MASKAIVVYFLAVQTLITVQVSTEIFRYHSDHVQQLPELAKQDSAVILKKIQHFCITKFHKDKDGTNMLLPGMLGHMSRLTSCLHTSCFSVHLGPNETGLAKDYNIIFATMHFEEMHQFSKLRLNFPKLSLVNITIYKFDVYYSGPNCEAGSLTMRTGMRSLKLCGKLPDDETYITDEHYVDVSMNASIPRSSFGILATMQAVDMATAKSSVQILQQKSINVLVTYSLVFSQTMKTYDKRSIYDWVDVLVMQAKFDERFTIFADIKLAHTFDFHDGPGIRSRSLSKYCNNDTCTFNSTTFVITVVCTGYCRDNDAIHGKFAIQISKAQENRQMLPEITEDYHTLSYNHPYNEGQNVQSVVRLEDHDNSTVDWEVRIENTIHKGPNTHSCFYGGLAIYESEQQARDTIKICNDIRLTDHVKVTFSFPILVIVFYSHSGYKTAGSGKLLIRNRNACFDMPGSCFRKSVTETSDVVLNGLWMDTWRMYGIHDTMDDTEIVTAYPLDKEMCHLFYQFPPVPSLSSCTLRFSVKPYVIANVTIQSGLLDSMKTPVQLSKKQSLQLILDGQFMSLNPSGTYNFIATSMLVVRVVSLVWSFWYYSIHILTQNRQTSLFDSYALLLEGPSFVLQPMNIYFSHRAIIDLQFARPSQLKQSAKIQQKVVQEGLVTFIFKLNDACYMRCVMVKLDYGSSGTGRGLYSSYARSVIFDFSKNLDRTESLEILLEHVRDNKMRMELLLHSIIPECYMLMLASRLHCTVSIRAVHQDEVSTNINTSTCPFANSDLIEGRCVEVMPTQMITWVEAEAECIQKGARLLDIKTEATGRKVWSLLQSTDFSHDIDITYMGGTWGGRSWFWHNDIPMAVSHWGSNKQPGQQMNGGSRDLDIRVVPPSKDNPDVSISSNMDNILCTLPDTFEEYGFYIYTLNNRTLFEGLNCSAIINGILLPLDWVKVQCNVSCQASFLCEYPAVNYNNLTQRNMITPHSIRSCPGDSLVFSTSCLFPSLKTKHQPCTQPVDDFMLKELSQTSFYFLLSEIFSFVHVYESAPEKKFKLMLQQLSKKTSRHSISLCVTQSLPVTLICPINTFTCGYGSCISYALVCDSHFDCHDGSDEIKCGEICSGSTDCSSCVQPNCTCSFEMYQCEQGGCIPTAKVCDGQPDCDSDERSCKTSKSALRTPTQQEPGFLHEKDSDTFSCKDMHNTEDVYHVDDLCKFSINDIGTNIPCQNGRHLMHCEDFQCEMSYKCPDSYCLPLENVCDGKPQCLHAEDELNCEDLACGAGLFRCPLETTCLLPTKICNGKSDCKRSGADESLCSFGPCPEHCTCVGETVHCAYQRLTEMVQGQDVGSHVRRLKLSNNFITESLRLPSAIPFLIFMNISSNLIAHVEPKQLWQNVPILQTLDVSNNSITTIDEGTFLENKYLRHLFLQSNFLLSIDIEHSLLWSLSLQKDYIWFPNRGQIIRVLVYRLFPDHYSCICNFQAIKLGSTCPVDVCKDLIPNISLAYALYSISAIIYISNICLVLVMTIPKGMRKLLFNRGQSKAAHRSAYLLAITDCFNGCLYGVYLSILGVNNWIMRGDFRNSASVWYNSSICSFTGMLSTVSFVYASLSLCHKAVTSLKLVINPLKVYQTGTHALFPIGMIFIICMTLGSALLTLQVDDTCLQVNPVQVVGGKSTLQFIIFTLLPVGTVGLLLAKLVLIPFMIIKTKNQTARKKFTTVEKHTFGQLVWTTFAFLVYFSSIIAVGLVNFKIDARLIEYKGWVAYVLIPCLHVISPVVNYFSTRKHRK